MQEEVRTLYNEINKDCIEARALQNLRDNTNEPEQALEDNPRKPYEEISPQIRALVVQKVMMSGEFSYEKAGAVYGISRALVGRIVHDTKKQQLDGAPKPPKKKRGRTSQLS
eukprot:TRINITY_DN1280_c0_g1_i2.p1 TRINITY_DN1280_c0_g1~~TRINITY_DN1280_c0_g1_i2.p1  ORF type:complete len:112 (-),score=28.80 TRINITY_DN1280_c0_g1_i2:231-566(-)